MHRLLALSLVVALFTVACGGGGAGDRASGLGVEERLTDPVGEGERLVLVDHRQPGVGTYYWRFLPRPTRAASGDTIVFRQQWSGEAHSIVFGTVADRVLRQIEILDDTYAEQEDAPTHEGLEAIERDFARVMRGVPVPGAYPSAGNYALDPCYLQDGVPDPDAPDPCASSAEEQPEFDGTQSWYATGMISPVGPGANTVDVKLADDIEPGVYRYFCAFHLPFMQGKIQVKSGEAIDLSGLERQISAEVEELAGPIQAVVDDAEDGTISYRGEELEAPFAGLPSDDVSIAVAEFVPSTLEVGPDEPIAWTVFGAHTISFGAPDDLEPFVLDDGAVVRNEEVDRATGGSPDPPPPAFDLPRLYSGIGDFEGPIEVDGGTWDGRGSFSSGLIGSDPWATYTLRISEPGEYGFRCLIHPDMAGSVTVR